MRRGKNEKFYLFRAFRYLDTYRDFLIVFLLFLSSMDFF